MTIGPAKRAAADFVDADDGARAVAAVMQLAATGRDVGRARDEDKGRLAYVRQGLRLGCCLRPWTVTMSTAVEFLVSDGGGVEPEQTQGEIVGRREWGPRR